MEGGCHCGKVRFKVDGEPTWIGTCYCTDCQKIGGATSMTMADFNARGYALTSGEAKIYQSSEKVTRTFCANCGSPLGYHHIDYPEHIEIPIGSFDDPSPLATQVHIWTSQKLPWVHICDDLPQSAED